MEVGAGDWWRRWCRQRSIRPWRIVSLQSWRRSRSSCMVMVMLLLLLLKLHRSNTFVAPNFHRRRLVEVQPIKSSCHGQSFFRPFVLLGPVFRLRIEDETKLSRIFNIFVVTSRGRVAIVTHEMTVVHRSANQFVIVFVNDVNLPNSSDQVTRCHETGMSVIATERF